MKRTLFTIVSFCLSVVQLWAQEPKFDLNPEGIEVYNEYKKATGFYVFTPDETEFNDSLGLVVFMHGFGGLNPLNYGAWLRELIEAGNAVIYPRYQRSIFLTSPKKFSHNAAEGIKGGIALIQNLKLPVDTRKIVYVGHSYGGTLSAFMMAKEDSLGLPKAYGGLLAAPGTNRLKGSRLTHYNGMSADAQLVIVTHDGDHTTGTEFAELVHKTAVHTKKRIWIKQAEQKIDSFSIGQGHNECYALDDGFDSGYRNYNVKRAIRIGCIDVIDRNLYWPLSLELTASAKTQDMIGVLREELAEFEFGNTPDGKLLKALPVLYGEPIVVPAENKVGQD